MDKLLIMPAAEAWGFALRPITSSGPCAAHRFSEHSEHSPLSDQMLQLDAFALIALAMLRLCALSASPAPCRAMPSLHDPRQTALSSACRNARCRRCKA